MLSKLRVGTLRYDAKAVCGHLNVSFGWPGSAVMARGSSGGLVGSWGALQRPPPPASGLADNVAVGRGSRWQWR